HSDYFVSEKGDREESRGSVNQNRAPFPGVLSTPTCQSSRSTICSRAEPGRWSSEGLTSVMGPLCGSTIRMPSKEVSNIRSCIFLHGRETNRYNPATII